MQRQKNSWFLYALFLSIVMMATSCHVKKATTGIRKEVKSIDTTRYDDQARSVVKQSRDNNIPFDQLSARIKIEYSDGTMSQDLSASVRMYRDSLIWLSLQGPFNIEGMRVLITRDSIFVINKLSNEYMHQPISYLMKVMPMQAGLTQMQDFLMGYYMLFADAVPEYKGLEDSLHRLQAQTPKFRYRSALYPQNYTLSQSLLTDLLLGHEMRVTFEGYTLEQGRPFSHDRTIDIHQGIRHINLHLAFVKMKINEPLNFPFDVDPGMKEVDTIRF
jgi:hypothetical protein